MSKSYRTISRHMEKCDGCMKCVEACADFHSNTKNPEHSRIQITPSHQTDKTSPSYAITLCRQCADAQCMMHCPSGALSKNIKTGVVSMDESRCVTCQLCTLSCESAGVTFNTQSNTVMKCDLCNGDPECVKVCPTGALQWLNASKIFNKWGSHEDLFAPGISACLGCNSELLIRHTLRRIGPEVVVATPPGCIAGVGAVGVNGYTATKTPVFHPLLTNTASMLAGARRYYNRIGRDVTMLAFAGDGGAADVGFQSLSGAAERGEQMIYICLDNEGYMNTGVQRSSTTPYGSWTSTTPVGSVLKGKTRDAKPMPLLMVMHRCEYVATTSMAFMDDFYAKLEKAIAASKKGLAYIHVFSPCPTGWRFPTDQLIEVSRKAVETNMFPLWEYEDDSGFIRFTHGVDEPLPASRYLSLVGKYKHLNDHQISHIQRTIDRQIDVLKRFSQREETGQMLHSNDSDGQYASMP